MDGLPDPVDDAQGGLSVLVVDDHRAFADSLRLAIQAEDDLRCVATAGTIDEAEAVAETTPVDVVLLDVHLPGGSGLDGIARLRAATGGARVVVLTGHVDIDTLAQAAAEGVAGFLPKEASLVEVLAAVRESSDRMLVDHETLRELLATVQARTPEPARIAAEAGLTAREYDVLVLLGEGMDPKTIAGKLSLSVHTVRGHVRTILQKLDAHTQLEAVVSASRRGMLPDR